MTNKTLHRSFTARLSVLFVLLALFAVPVFTAARARVIVRGDNAASAGRAVLAAGGTVTQDLPIIDAVAAVVPRSGLSALSGSPAVRSVDVDEPVHVQQTASPLHAPSAVYPSVSGANKLWSGGVNGSGVGVALIDTGIAKVNDLSGRVVGGVDLSAEGDPYKDSFGHGTFVAGLVAGNGASSGGSYKGEAPSAKLVSIKIAGKDGASDVSHVLAGIQ